VTRFVRAGLLVTIVSCAGTLSAAAAAAPTCSQAPSAVTAAATDVTATSAKLNGTVNPQGCDTTYHFEYGTTIAYGTTTPNTDAGSGTTTANVTASVKLAPNTTYHFRIVASNAAGTTQGSDLNFATPSSCTGSPGAVTRSATHITATSATLAASVTPNGCATTYHFEYGTSLSYGSTTADKSAGSGTKAVNVTTGVTLAPNTTYHFRVVASNDAGTRQGSDLTFTTPQAPCQRPTAQTQPATSVAATSATFNGAVTPRGCAATYQFEYGTTTHYGSTTPATNAGAGPGAVHASASAALAPSTTYHFRIVAMSAAGRTVGSDLTLTTPKAPPKLSHVTVVSRRVPTRRGFVAQVRLTCTGGATACRGIIRLFRAHRLIGRAGFALPANSTRTVSVRLNRRGRALMRAHRRARVEAVARASNRSARNVTLVRTFRVS
jgi:hypothetical protein